MITREMEDAAYNQLRELVDQGETRVIFDLLTETQIEGLAYDWTAGKEYAREDESEDET